MGATAGTWGRVQLGLLAGTAHHAVIGVMTCRLVNGVFHKQTKDNPLHGITARDHGNPSVTRGLGVKFGCALVSGLYDGQLSILVSKLPRWWAVFTESKMQQLGW